MIYFLLVCKEPLTEEEKSMIISLAKSDEYKTPARKISWNHIIAEIERVHGNKHSENKVKNHYYSKKRKDSKKKQEDITSENNYEKDDNDDHEEDEGDYDYDGDEGISSPSNSSTIDIDNDW